MTDYSHKSIAVIGMARTGLAVAEVVRDLGARVVLYDKKPGSELAEAMDLAARLGVEARAGTDEVDFSDIDVLIPSPGVARTLPVFAEAQSRGVRIISEIELAYTLSRAPIIAITGTNGKTTTTVLTGRMLAADGRDVYIAGNVAASDIRLPLVTAAHKASEHSVIVAEISTFQLEWIRAFRPKIGVLLNVTSDHMDRHASVEEYAQLKTRIFENQTPDDLAVINAENPFTASLAPQLNARVLKFARKTPVDEGVFVAGDEVIVRLSGRETAVCARSDIPLRGEHNVENVLAASCAAMAFGAKPESVLEAIRAFRPVEHRLESVAVIDGVEYINNSMCTNVDAAVRSVEAINEPQVVIAGGKDKGSDYTALGEAFKRKAKHVVLIGADAHLIRAAAENAGFSAVTDAGSMEEAVEAARELAEPGDVVVLTPACASFDMFSSFEDRGRVFKQIVVSYKTDSVQEAPNSHHENTKERKHEIKE
ncbi:MAG: UDP-N-acetylmuramoylalanine--D-glutamate ligase [Armatimonadetes bacterium RBG_16_58_9]|nr:MAG: UDP-N-acetylmuramoylalanine--D-glutamate ligase [Armatimonadetes bacterium RBG_16_58_9]